MRYNAYLDHIIEAIKNSSHRSIKWANDQNWFACLIVLRIK